LPRLRCQEGEAKEGKKEKEEEEEGAREEEAENGDIDWDVEGSLVQREYIIYDC
jgi:hypothetical protein